MLEIRDATRLGTIQCNEVNSNTREAQLTALPTFGLEATQADELRDFIRNTGLPIDSLTTLVCRPNDANKMFDLSSMGVGGPNRGELTVYDLLYRQSPDRRFAKVVHELAHLNSPYDRRNAEKFGGEPQREAIAAHVDAMADQSLHTRTYYDPYHRHLASRLQSKDLSIEEFREETFAIACERRITNPQDLLRIEREQSFALWRQWSMRPGMFIPSPIRLLSPSTEELSGLDNALICLLQDIGVRDLSTLNHHINTTNRHVVSLQQQEPLPGISPMQTADATNEDNAFLRRRQMETRLLQIAQVAMLAA